VGACLEAGERGGAGVLVVRAKSNPKSPSRWMVIESACSLRREREGVSEGVRNEMWTDCRGRFW
jgi:hypothetical protein